ncbi:MAG: T9SS type A sorting domain-containing protein, partial [candidate division Zixibacteria bacterium]
LLEDGFTDQEKFELMRSGFDNVSYSTPGNYSHLITVGPYRIDPGEFEVVAFAFAAGDDLNELISNAQIAFLLYPGMTGTESAEVLPQSFSVITNYPNPFNGSTIIEVSGALLENQVLNIYDIAGRLVSDLPLNDRGRVVWDGTDRHGAEVAAGIYFARLSNSSSAVRKMIFLK